MARKSRRTELQAGELNLTAMIDVAFQLLSFFIITTHPIDVYAHLNIFRPSPDARANPNEQMVAMIRITVYPDGYTINDKPMLVPQLETILAKMASLDKNQTILIQCLNQSDHGKLVALLDLCVKYGMHNLSVVSSGGA